MTIVNTLPNQLKAAKSLVYDNCGLDLTNLKLDVESSAYEACSFELNDKKIQYRLAKITPRKIGQFVTVWKRSNGLTVPFSLLDDFDFVIIAAKREHNFGQFIFPKLILAEMGIITINRQLGKLGFRIYAPWDKVTNKQAEKTQIWQAKYFFSIDSKTLANIDLVKKLLT